MLKHAVDAIFTYVSVNKIASCFSCAFLTFPYLNDVFGGVCTLLTPYDGIFLPNPTTLLLYHM